MLYIRTYTIRIVGCLILLLFGGVATVATPIITFFVALKYLITGDVSNGASDKF